MQFFSQTQCLLFHLVATKWNNTHCSVWAKICVFITVSQVCNTRGCHLQTSLFLLRSVASDYAEDTAKTHRWCRRRHSRFSPLHFLLDPYMNQPKPPVTRKGYHTVVDCIWNVMAHSDAREGKWRGNWEMDWVASTPSCYLGTWRIQHYYRWCAHLGCQ
jgi:hypothetical protein